MAQKQQQFTLTRFNPSPTAITAPRRGTNAEQRSYIEARKQIQVIGQGHIKTILGQQAIGDMSASYHQVFTQTAERIWEVKNQGGRPADLQQYIDGAANYIVQRTASYLEAATDAGAAQVISTINQPTYEPTNWITSRFSRKLRDE